MFDFCAGTKDAVCPQRCLAEAAVDHCVEAPHCTSTKGWNAAVHVALCCFRPHFYFEEKKIDRFLY